MQVENYPNCQGTITIIGAHDNALPTHQDIEPSVLHAVMKISIRQRGVACMLSIACKDLASAILHGIVCMAKQLSIHKQVAHLVQLEATVHNSI